MFATVGGLSLFVWLAMFTTSEVTPAIFDGLLLLALFCIGVHFFFDPKPHSRIDPHFF
jgi:hypothetical protein